MKKIKLFIARVLAQKVIGRIIKNLSLTRTISGTPFNFSVCNDSEAARIFFEIWERQEIKFAMAADLGNTIVELGSSIGVLQAHLNTRVKDTRIICVEASSINIKKLKTQINSFINKSCSYEIINVAIAYTNQEKTYLQIRSTTGNKISKLHQDPNQKYEEVTSPMCHGSCPFF